MTVKNAHFFTGIWNETDTLSSQVSISSWQYQRVKSKGSWQSRELEEWQRPRADIVLQTASDNPADKVFTGCEVISSDDSYVSLRNTIYKASTPLPAPVPLRHGQRDVLHCHFSDAFVSCRADSPLIAAHHFWAPLKEERNQYPVWTLWPVCWPRKSTVIVTFWTDILNK